MGRVEGMSRRPVTEDVAIWEMVKAYALTENVVEASKVLGISDKTLKKYLDRAGITRRRGVKKRSKPGPYRHWGKMSQWLRDHPDTVLPRSQKAIARLTGLSLPTVRNYLYNRRKKLRDHLSELTLPDRTIDVKGRTIPAMAVKTWTAKVDPWELDYVLRLTLRTGQITYVRLAYSQLETSQRIERLRSSSPDPDTPDP